MCLYFGALVLGVGAFRLVERCMDEGCIRRGGPLQAAPLDGHVAPGPFTHHTGHAVPGDLAHWHCLATQLAVEVGRLCQPGNVAHSMS